MTASNKIPLFITVVFVVILGGLTGEAFGQVEFAPWGNFLGIRVDGELMEFGSSLRAVNPDWSGFTQTSYEEVLENLQRPRYSRDGDIQTFTTRFYNLTANEVVEDIGSGTAKIDVEFTARADTTMAGAFFCIDLPGADYSGGSAQLVNASPSSAASVSLNPTRRNGQNEYVKATVGGARFVSQRRQLEIIVNEPTEIIIRDDRREGNTNIQVYFAVISGNVKEGQTAKRTFTLKAAGEIDSNPIEMVLDVTKPGRAFDGIGGNFRLQMPRSDPQIIDYCLENLPIKWGRMCMRWSNWQPEEDMDPIAAAKAGNLHNSVRNTMENARRLAQKDIRIIASVWFPPSWAIIPDPALRRQMRNHLKPEKMDEICESLCDYFVYLKEVYGVEPELFSFNESERGVYVLQTPEEHSLFIKTLGRHLEERGIATKMLLGDTAFASSQYFIVPAMEDPETHKYIGALAFHTWQGCTDENFAEWAEYARIMNKPLLATEGGPDARLHIYPDVAVEPWFQLAAIDLYTRICAICQPQSIMEWQFTADYSVLTGNGIYNTEGPLRTTQRFWNYKQLGATPPGSFALPLSCDRPRVTCAAFGDIAKGLYTIHMVNNGATRPVTLTGLPDDVNEMRMYVTDITRGMQDSGRVMVTDGTAEFTLDTVSYMTLISIP